jgi:hypothetical protein
MTSGDVLLEPDGPVLRDDDAMVVSDIVLRECAALRSLSRFLAELVPPIRKFHTALKTSRIPRCPTWPVVLLRQYTIGVVWRAFLRRCPFLALRRHRERQTAASGSTTRRSKVVGFYRRRRATRQRPAHRRKGRLQRLFRLLTGGLLVRVQPEEPFSRTNRGTRPRRRAFCDVPCDITRGRCPDGFAAGSRDGGGADGSGRLGSSASAAWLSACRRM